MKHSKYLNSGLINLIFLKELVSEMIEKKDVKDKIKSFALTLKKLPLIKEELDVFQQFMDSYIPDKRTASRLISEIKNDIKSKDWKELEKQRQMFFEDVKKIYPTISENLNDKIENYKYFASIKNFIDDAINQKLNAKDRIVIEESIVDTLITGKHIAKAVRETRESNQMPKEADTLVVGLMIKEFCNKWKKNSTPTQYQYLVEYASQGKSINHKWLNLLRNKMRKINPESFDEETKQKIDSAKELLETKIHISSEEIFDFSELLDELNK
jgi:hypothetical protein